jgi:hypothetical protein
METHQTGHSRLMSLVSSSGFWVAALPIAGLIGALGLVLAGNSGWAAVLLVAALALTAAAGSTWQQSCASARRRLHAALAAYTEREIRQQQARGRAAFRGHRLARATARWVPSSREGTA